MTTRTPRANKSSACRVLAGLGVLLPLIAGCTDMQPPGELPRGGQLAPDLVVEFESDETGCNIHGYLRGRYHRAVGVLISNKGGLDAVGPFSYVVEFDGIVSSVLQFGRLAAGAERHLVYPFYPDAASGRVVGDRVQLTVRIDPEDNVPESDPDNNEVHRWVEVPEARACNGDPLGRPRLPDLVVAFEYDELRCGTGDLRGRYHRTVGVRISNEGEANAVGPFNYQVEFDRRVAQVVEFGRLEVGGERHLAYTFYPDAAANREAGDRVLLWVRIDPEDSVEELSERNNFIELAVEVPDARPC